MLSKTTSVVFCKSPTSATKQINTDNLLNIYKQSNIVDQIKHLTSQNEIIIQNVYSTHANQDDMIQIEIDTIKQSVEEVLKDLKSLNQSRRSSTLASRMKGMNSTQHTDTETKTTTMSNKQKSQPYSISYQESKSKSVNKNSRTMSIQKIKLNLNIASMCTNTRNSVISYNSCTNYRRSKSIIYIPLNRLLNSIYVSQQNDNQIRVFDLDKSLRVGASKLYTYDTQIQTDLQQFISYVFADLKQNQTFVFHCMKGTNKYLMIDRILTILKQNIQKSTKFKFQSVDMIYMEKATNLEFVIRQIYKSIQTSSDDELFNSFYEQKSKYKHLKRIIQDQVQLNQTNKSLWISAKQTINRNLGFNIVIDDVEYQSTISFLFQSPKQNKILQIIPNTLMISEPEQYQNFIKKLGDNMMNVYCLNPQIQAKRQFDEFVEHSKQN